MSSSASNETPSSSRNIPFLSLSKSLSSSSQSSSSASCKFLRFARAQFAIVAQSNTAVYTVDGSRTGDIDTITGQPDKVCKSVTVHTHCSRARWILRCCGRWDSTLSGQDNGSASWLFENKTLVI